MRRKGNVSDATKNVRELSRGLEVSYENGKS